ncbi:MAG: protein translocase subunit SecD [Sedimentisphaerales bacterium]|nr:protein translocase subunit SecD [Sedimentisphaerales bacterium]
MSNKVKFFIVLILLVICVLSIWPPDKKLKKGIDLAGGASLLYRIDTSDMEEYEKRNIAQNMIRVLQERIDPGNKRNLIWRPHGTDQIEIQMPLAKDESRDKRKLYQETLDKLEAYNINMRRVDEILIQPAGMSDDDYKARRARDFTALAGESSEQLNRLNELAQAYDELTEAKIKRGAARQTEMDLKQKVQDAGINEYRLNALYTNWDSLDDPNRVVKMEEIVGDAIEKQQLIKDYFSARKVLDEIRQAITGENGLQNKETQARDNLKKLNIEISVLKEYLSAPKGTRAEEIKKLKEQNPQNIAVLLDELVLRYDDYEKVAGRYDDPEDLKKALEGSGVLEFRIIPTIQSDTPSAAEIKNYKERLKESGPKKASDERYVWKEIKDPKDFGGSRFITERFVDKEYVLASNQPGDVLLHEIGPDAWKLRDARIGTDQFGGWAVNFGFNAIGAGRFWNLTKNHLQEPLCIFLDDKAISAPNIKSAISDNGQITGRYTQVEAWNMVDKLNAGSLPARLGDQPISENSIGPTLGQKNLENGLKAGIWGLIAVATFMLVYYMVAGSLADIALLLNLIFIMGVMAFSRATFTMPGIAGLILTIGMAVDANVLIFERIREEQSRGCSLRIAIKNGYDRAFRTIFDANLTTFLVAGILYLKASEEVKGFAITLMIGIISSMFTALFVTRMIFDILTNLKILTKRLPMLQLIHRPNVDWLGKRPIFWTISFLCVVGGWAVFLGRDEVKNSKYSIEFTGGTSIHVILTKEGVEQLLRPEQKNLSDEEKSLALRESVEEAVRSVGEKTNNPELKQARVQRVGEPRDFRFEITTTETNQVEVTLSLEPSNTSSPGEIQEAIGKAAIALGDRRMEDLTVTAQNTPGRFLLLTSQTNINKINDVIQKALPEAGITYKTLNIVSDAVTEALEGKLDTLSDLGPELTESQPITDELISKKPYLNDYRSGLYLKYKFSDVQHVTMAHIENRLEESRTKSVFYEQYGNNPFVCFAPDNTIQDKNTPLESVEIAIISPDVTYEGSTAEEWKSFTDNETARFTDIFQLRTSLPQVTQIDPSVGQKSMNDAMIAIVISLLAIVGYIWFRFGNIRFGVAAVVALIHDVSIAMGLVAASAWLAETSVGKALLISDFKIDLPMIAGFLTVIGYSLNDTIVVFDRIRENRGKLATLSQNIINDSINQTLSRTILTSMTTLMVLFVMYIFGGSGLRSFNYVMIIGVIVGTYSSIGIAAPLLYGAKVVTKKDDNTIQKK